MVTKSKLKIALAAEKGIDFKKLGQKKKQKEALKKKKQQNPNGGAKVGRDADSDDEEWEDDKEVPDLADGGAPLAGSEGEDEEEEEDADFDLAGIDESDDSDSSIEMEEKIVRKPKSAVVEAKGKKAKNAPPAQDDDDEEEEEEDEEDIPMSDLEDLDDEDKEDLIPHTRLTINNTSALLASLNRIAIPTGSSVPFKSHQTIVSSKPTAESIPDVQDDLQRELALYAQCLEAAKKARTLLKKEGVPFTRPNDYFAEMVKDDGHMEKVKAKLIEEASAKKASAEARKLRDMKKFGKQVQVAKLQERQKAKRETLDKIKNLKRKRQESSGDVGEREADLFDVGVESELKSHNSRKTSGRGEGGSNMKRQKKDSKYGFGGKKRNSKSGDAFSSGDMSGFSAKKMKMGTKGKVQKTARLGKSRRNAAKR